MNKTVTPVRKELITRLGILRNRKGLSARELSGRLGFSVAYIAKFENGDFSIPAEVLLDAIEVCDSTPEEFFFRDISLYKDIKEIINLFSGLSKESKSTIIELMKNMK